MVDRLAEEYSDAPVVFLELNVDDPPGDRISRWWAAWGSGGSVYLPLIQVDSGHQISNGYVSFYTRYRAMVEAALQRPPLARLEVDRERVGDAFRFQVTLTNLSDATLGTANGAALHAIVYEETRVADTGRWVRAAAARPITSLAPGESRSYTLEVPLTGVNWDRLHSVVLADYRPDGAGGPFDMLQASHQ